MTIAQLRAQLTYFDRAEGQLGWDDEAAHATADGIRRELLAAIADGTAEDPVEMARLATATDALGFARWCA